MALDWPLSREEKKECLMKLYDLDLWTLDGAHRSGEAKIEALHEELLALRRGSTRAVGGCKLSPEDSLDGRAGKEQMAPSMGESCLNGPLLESDQNDSFVNEAMMQFQTVFANATAALGTLFASGNLECEGAVDDDADQFRLRARSEGANRDKMFRSALRKPHSRRHSRGGAPERRVSFERHEDKPESLCELDPTEAHEDLLDPVGIERVPPTGVVDHHPKHMQSCLNQLRHPTPSDEASAQNPIRTQSGFDAQRRGRQRARLRGTLHAYSIQS
jgi:hypothetical protein